MFCPICGRENNDNAMFCEGCGNALNGAQQAPQQNAYQQDPYQQNAYQPNYNQAPAPAQPGKGLAIASLVLGIISFLCFPAITGTLGIIFGGVAKSKGFKGGMATAGIVCGVIGVALWLIMLIAMPDAYDIAAWMLDY